MAQTPTHDHSVIEQVPVDYYQNGIQKNILQKIWHTNKLKTIVSLIPLRPKTILDVGCASGWFLSQISKSYPEALSIGVDVYDKALSYGKKHYPHISFRKSNAEKLPFRSHSFDLVISTEVLEHVENPKKMISEIYRVTKPQGYAIIELDSGNKLFALVWHLWTHLQGKVWNHAHLHIFTPDKLIQLLKDSGFIVQKKKIFNWTMAMAILAQKK